MPTAIVSIHAFDPETGTYQDEPFAKSSYADHGVLQVTVPFPAVLLLLFLINSS